MSNTRRRDSAAGNPARVPVAFAAIGTYVERDIVSPRETKMSGTDRVRWGDGDAYPDFLASLYMNVTTLHSLIDGCVDYIAGDDVYFDGEPDREVNKSHETARDLVEMVGRDWEMYGGFAIQVIRDHTGAIAELYWIDMRFLRSNDDNTVFWYSETWPRGGQNRILYPAFMPGVTEAWASLTEEERGRHVSSIVYVKRDRTCVYPSPCYAAAVKACEIERGIDDYHLNALENGFAGSAVINFNNGIPTDEVKEEIERDINEKFGGHQNAGRIMCSWNPNKESAATIEKLEVEDFGERYKALETASRQKIFTAFRANPNLFGIPTENLGFSSEEYESAFKLFNRTHVRPIQRRITDAFSLIYGRPVLTIEPFTLDGSGELAVR